MSDEVLETISQPLISEEKLMQRYNESYKRVKNKQTPTRNK